MIELLFEEKNIEDALNYLFEKKDTYDRDRMSFHDLPRYLSDNKESLMASVLDGSYKPEYAIQSVIVSKKGKSRTISKYSTVDRFIAQLAYQLLYPIVESLMFNESHAYQKGKSTKTAADQCRGLILDGYAYVVNVDFTDCFGSFDHGIMRNTLARYLDDAKFIDLIMKIVTCDVLVEYQLCHVTKGILQGCPLSPLLCNLYLIAMDEFLHDLGVPFVRYADDIRVFVKDKDAGDTLLQEIGKMGESDLHLSLNTTKSSVTDVYETSYFGYKFNLQKNDDIAMKRNSRSSGNNWYREWTPGSLSVNNGVIHILEDGILNKSDMTFLFENEESKQYIPLETTHEINSYSNMVFSTTVFKTLNQKKITMNLFDDFGEMIGTFTPCNASSDMHLVVKQATVLGDEDKTKQYALIILQASLRNMIAVLRYYRKQKNQELLISTIDLITDKIESLEKASSITEMSALEGQARKAYYACFNIFINDPDFAINGRNRKPPKDPTNALISFGNTFLYNRINSLIQRTRLDSRISFIHSPYKRNNSLSLDLADIYKPTIVDRTIFSMLNKKMLTLSEDFEKQENGGIYLTHDAMKKYIVQLKIKLQTPLKEGVEKRSYMSIIRHDIHELAESFTKEDPTLFKPFIQKV